MDADLGQEPRALVMLVNKHKRLRRLRRRRRRVFDGDPIGVQSDQIEMKVGYLNLCSRGSGNPAFI